ncbi:hypothetical protein ccbrp13_15800 [Ktedonobacteria bacterium brp13]|nr:hypothetical protein ccbrp13_15800 [Ktedonobacteria bacterium brp13]
MTMWSVGRSGEKPEKAAMLCHVGRGVTIALSDVAIYILSILYSNIYAIR